MKNLKTLIALVALLPVIAAAQTVTQREHDQHKRIVQGIRSGALTHREATRLHNREAVLHAQVRRDRYFHHGHLTLAEKHRLQREQNRASRAIYKQKHDAQHRG